MRIWDIDPSRLCRQHLLGEHRELHGCWNILTQNKTGYSKHPETKRWVGRLPALRLRHEALVAEMQRRGYNHKSPLVSEVEPSGLDIQDQFVDTPEDQIELLRQKGCECRV